MFLIFFTIVTIVLTLVHLVIYKTSATIFALSFSSKWTLGIILTFLGLSFIIASILNSQTDNWIFRLYYHLSAIWIGFMTYLFIASCMFAIVLFISKLFTGTGVVIVTHGIGVLLYVIAILGGIYGLLNARGIVVRNAEITIPNIPISWQDKKILMFSDSHFGAIHYEAKAREILDHIKEIKPDTIFIPGDFYDGSKLDYGKFANIIGEFKPQLGTYFVTGNHEEFRESNQYTEALENAGIKVLKDEAVIIDGIRIIGVGDRNSLDKDKLAHILEGGIASTSLDNYKQIKPILPTSPDRQNTRLSNDKMPTILLKHQPRQLDIAESHGVDLQLSGHTHRAQMFPLNILTKYIYQGYDYGLKNFGKMQVLTTSGVGTWGPPMRVGSKNEMWVIKFR